MGEQLDLVPMAQIEAGSPLTLRRHRRAQHSWRTYCADRGLDPIDAPDGPVIAWLTERLRNKPSRLGAAMNLSAIRRLQLQAEAEGKIGVPYRRLSRPRLDAWIRLNTEQTPKRRAPAMLLRDLQIIVRTTLDSTEPRRGVSRERAMALAIRDACILSIQWWGAMRADDMWRIYWRNIELCDEGVVLHLESSKTGPALLALAYRPELGERCPVQLLLRWKRICIDVGDYADDAKAFLKARDIDRMVRRRAREAGITKAFTGHSLRSGFATEAARQGVADILVQRHARWQSSAMHQRYVREGRLWLDSPTRMLTVE